MSEPRKPRCDWEAVEKEYRAGQLSIREIGRRHGVNDKAIRKKATELGWSRDLAGKVRAKVDEKLVRSLVREANADDAQIIEQAAERGAAVVESHRADINQGRRIAGMLMDELRSNTENIQLLEELVGQQADEEDWNEKRKAAVNRAISLPSRAGVMRDLATAMKTMQGLERQAFNLDAKEQPDDSPDISDTERAARVAAILDSARARRAGSSGSE